MTKGRYHPRFPLLIFVRKILFYRMINQFSTYSLIPQNKLFIIINMHLY